MKTTAVGTTAAKSTATKRSTTNRPAAGFSNTSFPAAPQSTTGRIVNDQISPAFRTAAKTPTPAGDEPAPAADGGDEAAKSSVDPNVIVAVAAGLLCLLLIGFAVVFLVATRMSRPDPAEVAAAAAADARAAERARRAAIVYREVNLPETQRQQIFRDMQTAADSSVDAKIPLPKDSKVEKFVRDNLQKIVDREAKMHSIMNNIEVDDVAEIMKEGDAKQW